MHQAAARSITGLAGRGPRRQPPARSMTGLRADALNTIHKHYT